MTAYEIAVRIDNFGYMNDTYEYNDQIDPEQREDNILGITKFLEEKDDVVIAYLNRYACKARNDYEDDGSLEDYTETENSITLRGKYYTDYFEIYNADYLESHNRK